VQALICAFDGQESIGRERLKQGLAQSEWSSGRVTPSGSCVACPFACLSAPESGYRNVWRIVGESEGTDSLEPPAFAERDLFSVW